MSYCHHVLGECPHKGDVFACAANVCLTKEVIERGLQTETGSNEGWQESRKIE